MAQKKMERVRDEMAFARQCHTDELARLDRDNAALKTLYDIHTELFYECHEMFEKAERMKRRGRKS